MPLVALLVLMMFAAFAATVASLPLYFLAMALLRRRPHRAAYWALLPWCAATLAIGGWAREAFLNEPLVDRAWSHEVGYVEPLLRRGASPDAEDRDGTTALVAAVRGGNLPVVELLIREGADVNRPSTFSGRRETPLQAAAGHPRIAEVLRRAGARR